MKRAFLFAAIVLVAAPAAQAATLGYNVVTTFHEPDTQPYNTIFTGTFTFNDVTKTVTNLKGTLTESMTGNAIVLSLDNQLSAVADAGLGGLLVTVFKNANTNTLTTQLGGDGWTPGSDGGTGLYYGFPGTNPGNAYVRIFVNTTNPLAGITPAQINKLAYADCAPGGMMGAACMTGTTVAGYGFIGTMGGYPVTQQITAIPEPTTGALVGAGAALLRFVTRRSRRNG